MSKPIPMDYFKPKEIFCNCKYNCGLGFDDLLHRTVQMMNQLRHKFGYPLAARSTVRCPRHNYEVGGANLSFHIAVPKRMKGMAADLHPMGAAVELLWQVADELFPDDQVGFYDWGIHIAATGRKMRFDKRSKK